MAALVAISCPVAASAQDTAIGSRLRPREDVAVKSGQQALVEAQRYAACIVNKRSSSARRTLDAVSEVEFQAADRVLTRELVCNSLVSNAIQQVGQSVSMSRDVFRGNLAEALIEASGSRPALPASAIQPQYSSAWTEVSGRDVVVEEMAVCIAATQPASIATLLATRPGSDPEAAAIRNMAPSFGPCLVSSARLTANRPSLRAALAEALYHRLNPAATLGAAPAGK